MAMLGKIRRMYHRDKLSVSEIARRTSISRNTIKKWLQAPGAAEPKYTRQSTGKIVPFPMTLPIVKAASDEAHRKGKLVFAHPSTMEGAQLVLEGHVDVLAHAIEEPCNWDAALCAGFKQANVRAGMDADLTVLDADPAQNINAFAHVVMTIRQGQIIYRKPAD